MLLITGSPASRGPQDLWAFLNLLKPKVFPSYWAFVNTFCIVLDGPFGKEIVGVKNAENLRKILRQGLMIRRLKKDVLPELPPQTRQVIPVEMSDQQEKLYNTLVDDMILECDPDNHGRLIITPNGLALRIRLRQLLVCPKLLDPSFEYGAGLEAIKEMLEDRDREDQHCVIYTPFRKALPYITEYLQAHFDIPIWWFEGGLKPDDLRFRSDHFKADRGIGICVIAYAESFSLESCSTGFFLGYEYDPEVNYQAEDRIHRMTSKNPVWYGYIKYLNTVDNVIMEILNGKRSNVRKALEDPANYK